MGRPVKHELDDVLWRATRLFWRHGSDAVSTRDLESALDLRAPAIYRRFGSKHGLLARCIDHYVDRIIGARIVRYLEGAADPLDGLHTFFTSTLAPPRKEPALRGCLLANTAAHADAQVPAVRDAIHRGWDRIDEAFQTQLRRAQETGELDPALDPAALSQALVMSLEGLLTLVRATTVDLQPGVDMTFQLLGRTASTTEGTGR